MECYYKQLTILHSPTNSQFTTRTRNITQDSIEHDCSVRRLLINVAISTSKLQRQVFNVAANKEVENHDGH